METTNTYAARPGVRLTVAAAATPSAPVTAVPRPRGSAAHSGMAALLPTQIVTAPSFGTGAPWFGDAPVMSARKDGFATISALPPWSPPVR